MAKRQKIDPQQAAGLFKKTEETEETQPGQLEAQAPEDPVQPIGIGLKESEWRRLEEIAGELGLTRHKVAMYALRDFIRRYEAGEIRTETKRTLPGM